MTTQFFDEDSRDFAHSGRNSLAASVFALILLEITDLCEARHDPGDCQP